MTRQLAGPAALALAALVARRYFLDERSKVEIAGELGLSRFKVARSRGSSTWLGTAGWFASRSVTRV